MAQLLKQSMLGGLHAPGGFGVAHACGYALQGGDYLRRKKRGLW